jgi:glycosyltransferase involved in cell wall biosynthesis
MGSVVDAAILPRVSIMIPTYNRAHYLPQTVDSALRQDYANLEVLLLDNASTDDTPGIAARYRQDPRFRHLRNDRNIGMVANWRSGLYEHARGEWFLLLSDDDYLIDDRYIGKAVEIARADPDVVMVYANGYILEEATGAMTEMTLPWSGIVDGRQVFMSRDQVRPQDFTLCNVMFRRAVAMEQDAFHNPNNLSCDSELFLRMSLLGKVGVCGDRVSVYRRHATNLISGVHLNFDQLVHNTELFLLPYRLALDTGRLGAGPLEQWRSKKVARNLRWTLSMIRTYHRPRLLEAVAYFSARYGKLFWSSLKLKDRLRLELMQIGVAFGARKDTHA